MPGKPGFPAVQEEPVQEEAPAAAPVPPLALVPAVKPAAPPVLPPSRKAPAVTGESPAYWRRYYDA